MSQTKLNSALQQNAFVDVYIAEIPANGRLSKVCSDTRQAEIDKANSEKVKREKYYAWKLLEYGLQQSFDKKIEDVEFVKQATGKWTCNVCEFSLSHSHNVVCVALSNSPIGVDVEKIETPRVNVVDKILSEEEKAEYNALQGDEKDFFLIRIWAKKESLFKAKNIKSLTFEAFKNQEGEVVEKTLRFADGEYALAVATESPENAKIYNGSDWLKA